MSVCLFLQPPPAQQMIFVTLRENLQRLLEDKSFKEEIVHFSISEENTIVKVEHRPHLVPVLMRFVTERWGEGSSSKYCEQSCDAAASHFEQLR